MSLRSVFSFHRTGLATPYIRQVGRFRPIAKKLQAVQIRSDKNIIGARTVVHLHPLPASSDIYRQRNKHFFEGRQRKISIMVEPPVRDFFQIILIDFFKSNLLYDQLTRNYIEIHRYFCVEQLNKIQFHNLFQHTLKTRNILTQCIQQSRHLLVFTCRKGT